MEASNNTNPWHPTPAHFHNPQIYWNQFDTIKNESVCAIVELKLVTNLAEPLFTVAHIEDSMIIACLESEDADVELLRQHIKAHRKEQHFMTKEAVK